MLVPTSIYKAIYAPGRGTAAAYLATNGPGMAWRAVSLTKLREIARIEVFPGVPATTRDRLLPLPEPRPNNVRGACEGQAEVASAGPSGGTRDRTANPAPPSPHRHRRQKPTPKAGAWQPSSSHAFSRW